MPQMTDIAAKSTSPRRDTPAEAAPFAIDVLPVVPARCVPESRISKVARARAAHGCGRMRDDRTEPGRTDGDRTVRPYRARTDQVRPAPGPGGPRRDLPRRRRLVLDDGLRGRSRRLRGDPRGR